MTEISTRLAAYALAATSTFLIALGLGLAQPAGAQQATLGPNLGQYQANVNFGCETSPAPPFFATGVDTCSFLPTSATDRLAVPGPGVITRVRVKTGPPPMGPMRITVARQLGGTTTGLACCFFAGESPRFTPAANRTNTISTRIPVTAFTDINAGQTVVDFLALTVLGTPIRIPGQLPGNNDLEGSIGYYPHLGAAPSDAQSGRSTGFGNSMVPLMQADWVALCGGAASARTFGAISPTGFDPDATDGSGSVEYRQAETSAGRCLGGVTARDGSLRGRTARVPLDCNLVTGCRGKLTLLGTGKGASASKSAKLGKGKIKLNSGARKQVKVKLTKRGKKAAKRKKLKAVVKAKVKGGPNERAKITLKK